MDFAQKRMGFSNRPKVLFADDPENAAKPLGKTAFYDPNNIKITIFVNSRHVKDILRSLAHELVHHMQNEKGDLHHDGHGGLGYAQKNPKLRQMEREAYEMGNMCFRDWEDGLKQMHPTIYNERRNRKMSLKDWKNKELMENLFQKWGVKSILNEDLSPTADGDVDVDIERSDSESDALPDTPPPMPANPEGLPEAKGSVLSEASLKDHKNAVRDSDEYKNLPRGSEVKELLNMFLQLKAVNDPDPNVADYGDFMRLLKKRGDESSEKAKAIVNKYDPDRMDEAKEDLEEKLGDGKTQGTDSVEAGLDDNPEFTRADLGAEQGGARGGTKKKASGAEEEAKAKEAKKSGKPEKEPKKMNESLNRKIRVSIKK